VRSLAFPRLARCRQSLDERLGFAACQDGCQRNDLSPSLVLKMRFEQVDQALAIVPARVLFFDQTAGG
jgi:hypothetical protein